MTDLFEQLGRHATARPNDVALRTVAGTSAECVTFSELISQARELSRLIQHADIASGSRVALLLPNDHHFGVAFLAAASAGAVIVPLDASNNVQGLCDVITNAECRLLICNPSEQSSAVREQLPELSTLDPHIIPNTEMLPPWPLASRASDADFLLMYTGGTTGAPKGVRLTLRSILITIQDTLDVFPLSAKDNVLSILPMFHIMAIQANLLGPLYAGAQVTYLQTRDPQAVISAFREQRITAFLCVPMFYYQLHRRIFEEIARQPRAKRIVFKALYRTSHFLRITAQVNAGRLFFRPIHDRFGGQLRGFGVGAARFAPEIAADLHDLGFAFFQGYGMTETSGLAAISPMSLQGGLSSGRPLRNMEIRIDSPDAQGRGEILLRGANIMKGYWKDEEATTSALADGWLHTGDVGHFTGEVLRIVGRKKEVIVLSSGKNIFPEPLEIWFQSNCALIQEMCIFGLSDDHKGAERLHAVLVPDSQKLRQLGIVNIREEFHYQIENLNRNLASHEKLLGFDIRFEPLPRTSSRKLQRFLIQEEFATMDRTASREPVSTRTDQPCNPIIREMIERIKPGSEAQPWMNLELDLAFDSLERVELLANMQETFGLRLEPEQAAGIFTVADVMALARDLAPASNDWADWRDILHEPLSKDEQALADQYLGARPIAAPLLFAATKMFCLAAKLLLRFRAHPPREWTADGPLILCSNHQSFIDFPLIAGSLPYSVFRRLFSLSATRLLRSGFQTWFGRTARSVPIDPDRNPRIALRIAAEGLRRGMVLCVFPEGHRSINGQLQAFRKGPAIVAVETNAQTIPIRIAGTGRVWGRANKRIRLAPVSLGFGPPIWPSTGESYESFNRRLFDAIQGIV